MKQERLFKIILSPHVSEKSSIATEKRREYAFKVTKSATKNEIKDAIELMFKVQVALVRVMNIKAKQKRFGNIVGKRKPWKKAYVTLQENQSIDLGGAK